MGQFIIFIVFVVISVIRAISKAANEQGAAQRQRDIRNANPDRKRKVQSEIEAFLNEVTGDNEADSAQQRREALERRKRREQAKRKQFEKEERRRRQAAAAKKAEEKTRRPFGSGISDHVDQYINKHVEEYVDNDVNEYVEATIVDSVEEHLGDRPDTSPVSQVSRTEAAEAVVKLLKDPKGVRNAILVNEILSRPAALRR